MRFTPALARAIVAGRKTQTRLPVIGPACPLKVGHDYGVQTHARRDAVCRVKVISRSRQRVGDITHRDARAEGFRTTDDFKVHWVRVHERAWIKRELIDLAAAFDDTCSVVNWILLRRFEQRHGDTPVWAIVFAVQHDASWFMAKVGGPQYTENRARAIDDLEVVPGGWLEQHAAEIRAASDAHREAQRAERENERQRRRNMRALLRHAA